MHGQSSFKGHVCLLVVLNYNDDILFYPDFDFIWGYQKSALPTLFHFVGVRATLQLHEHNLGNSDKCSFLMSRKSIPGIEKRRKCPDPYPAMTSPRAILFQMVNVVTGNSP